MVMLLITRLLVCCVMVVAVKRAIPTLRWRFPDDWSMLKPLLAFGGWMSISNVVSPVLIYLDRFMLGAFVGLAAVGFYTAPFDGVIRMLIVPGSLVNALFPSISGMHATDDRIALNRLFSKAVRNMSLVLAGPALVLMLFGPTLLRIWLGETFAQQGGLALRILAFGVFLNSLAHVPSSFVAALGRPDISAKFHMVELVLHVPLAWWLIRHFGVPGAATAWAFRVTVDAVLLFAAMSRLLDTPIHSLFLARGVQHRCRPRLRIRADARRRRRARAAWSRSSRAWFRAAVHLRSRCGDISVRRRVDAMAAQSRHRRPLPPLRLSLRCPRAD